MSEMFTKCNGFIVSADPFVQHDSSMSGNGTVNSPLGMDVSNAWVNVSNEFSATTALNNSHLNVAYNPYLGMVQVGGSFYVGPTASVTLYNAPTKYKPIIGMEFHDGSRYYDFVTATDTNNFLKARTGTAGWCSINFVYACNNTATN